MTTQQELQVIEQLHSVNPKTFEPILRILYNAHMSHSIRMKRLSKKPERIYIMSDCN